MKSIDADALKHEFARITYVRWTADMGQGGYDNFTLEEIVKIIDNAPTVEQRIEYGADGQPYRLFMSGGQIVPDVLQGWKYEERPQGDIRWTDKLSVTSNGDIIDFEGQVVGHINLEDMIGGAE